MKISLLINIPLSAVSIITKWKGWGMSAIQPWSGRQLNIRVRSVDAEAGR